MAILSKPFEEQIKKDPAQEHEVIIVFNDNQNQSFVMTICEQYNLQPLSDAEGYFKGKISGKKLLELKGSKDIYAISPDEMEQSFD